MDYRNTRTWEALAKTIVGDYRFYKNSIKDFSAQGHDIDEHFDVDQTPAMQSFALGLPSVAIYPSAEMGTNPYFDVPNGILSAGGNWPDTQTAFTLEYLGMPMQNAVQDHGAIPLTRDYGYILGNANNSDGIKLRQLGTADPVWTLAVEYNGGAGDTATEGPQFWLPSGLLHIVVTRTSGEDGRVSAYVNGTVVMSSANAGTAGTNSPIMFDGFPGAGVSGSLCGNHFSMRFFDTSLKDGEAAYLYQKAQQLFQYHKFMLPIEQQQG